MIRYSCDFETNNKENDCRVWGWGCCEIWKSGTFIYGKDIDSFMMWLFDKKRDKSICYFHNAKFDTGFVIPWLFKKGYKNTQEINEEKDGYYFQEIRTDMGQVYAVTIYNKKTKRGWNKVTIQDSLKIINSTVELMAKGFNLEQKKGSIDYNKERPIGYDMNENELDYLKNDVEIVAQCLAHMFELGYTKMTMSANALGEYKSLIGKREFERYFPVLNSSVDSYLRKSYKGGITYCNPVFQSKDIKKGVVLDVVSLYPSRMKLEMLPYGVPLFYLGKYKNDKIYHLYIQRLVCLFEVKGEHMPMLQIKNYDDIPSTEYLTDDKGEPRELTLTNVELDLFFDQYNVEVIEWLDGYKFKGKIGLFDDYIDKWFKEKDNAKATGNKAMYAISKYFLNTLYGKFGTNPIKKSKVPYMGDDGIVHYEDGKESIEDSVYVAMASFITAYGRNLLVREGQKVYDRLIYTDTDSLHLTGWGLPKELEVNGKKIGAWDDELYFNRGRFLCAKRYIEQYYNDLSDYTISKRKVNFKINQGYNGKIEKPLKSKVTCAGMPSRVHSQVQWDNFKIGEVFYGKLAQKVVRNGIVLNETSFKLNLNVFGRF